ncbi:MAG: protein-disulfide reductase DsbD, partial [Thiomonas sp.]
MRQRAAFSLHCTRCWAQQIRRLLLGIALLWVAVLLPVAQAQQGDFLPPDEAFQFTAKVQDAKTVLLQFKAHQGYYMYQERFHFEPQTPDVELGKPDFPPAHVIFDKNLGHEVAHYRGLVSIPIPVLKAPASFKMLVIYQGCADSGLCYPPIEKLATVSLSGFGGNGTVSISEPDAQGGAAAPVAGGSGSGGLIAGLMGKASGARAASSPAAAGSAVAAAASTPSPAIAQGGESSRIGAALASGSLLTIVPMFLVFGLLLAFTPCVLPMIPILSSIIVGQGEKVSRGRGFALAVAYALGMAIVYTAFGVAAGLLGQGLAASLQNPWVLSVFALLLVALSLSMFGFYELQVPSSLQSKLSSTSDKLQGGHFAGVFIMGGISALIVGPCVAAPLAGALLYISQTGNALIGGVALFSLAAGMSMPLLLVGLGAGTLLPRAGGWMDGVKAFFGVLLIATALYMIAPVLPTWLLMALWALLLLVSASYLRAFDSLPLDASGWKRLFKGFGVALAVV